MKNDIRSDHKIKKSEWIIPCLYILFSTVFLITRSDAVISRDIYQFWEITSKLFLVILMIIKFIFKKNQAVNLVKITGIIFIIDVILKFFLVISL